MIRRNRFGRASISTLVPSSSAVNKESDIAHIMGAPATLGMTHLFYCHILLTLLTNMPGESVAAKILSDNADIFPLRK
jgi:hypothetical protein